MQHDTSSASPLLRWLFGLPFTLAGIIIVVSAITGNLNSSSDAINESPLLGTLIGTAFLIPGVWALQPHRFLNISLPGTPETRSTLFAGALFFLIGTLIIAMSFVGEDEMFEAPRWVVGLAGVVFALPGLYALKTLFVDRGVEQDSNFLSVLVMAILLTCFGAIATWVSVGDGERRFEGSITVLFFTLPAAPSEIIGRLCFLPGALILDGCALYLWAGLLKQTFQTVRVAIQRPGPERRAVLTASAFVLVITLIAAAMMVAQRMYYLSLPR